MNDESVPQAHHWPEEESPPAPTKKKGRLARIGDEVGGAIETIGIGGAMGSRIPNVGRNPLVDQRVVAEKITPRLEHD